MNTLRRNANKIRGIRKARPIWLHILASAVQVINNLQVVLIQIVSIFMIPFGVSAWLLRRGLPGHLAVAAALPAGPVMALAVFWLAWMALPGHRLGLLAGSGTVAFGIALAIAAAVKGQWRSEIMPPLGLAALAALGLITWTDIGHEDSRGPLQVAATRWTHALPGDNAIPFDLAKGFSAGRIPTPLHANWLSSDRPPLQTALYMTTPDWLVRGPKEVGYQAAGVALQMTVLLSTWVLLRAFGVGGGLALGAMAAVFFTPLVLVNGAFVWPKLLPAAFLLAAAAIHLTPEYSRVKDSARWGGIIGALCALAMLGHGGSAFAIVGMGVAALVVRRLATLRYLASAALVFSALYLPWVAYQKFVDPPGDGLLKMQLAGVSNNDPRPLLQTIEDSYRSRSFAQVAEARRNDFGVIFAHIGDTYSGTMKAAEAAETGSIEAAHSILHQIHVDQFFCLVVGTGLLGLGLYALPLGGLDRELRPLTLAVMASLLIWIALMFNPASTVIHQGSLFPEIALIVGVLAVAARRSYVAVLLVVAHSALTAFQYIL
jgi:hypothetical protein